MPRQVYFVGPSGKSLVVDVEQEDTLETLTAKIQAKNGGVIPEELRCDWDSPQMGKEHPDGFTMTTSEVVQKVLFWTRGRTTAGLQGVTTFMDILEPDVEIVSDANGVHEVQDEDGNPVPGIFMVRSDDVPSFNFSMPDDLEAEGEAEEPSVENNVSGPQAFSYRPIFFNNDGGKMADNKQKRAKNRMEDYVDQVREALEKRGATEELCAEFEHDARAFKSWFYENNRFLIPFYSASGNPDGARIFEYAPKGAFEESQEAAGVKKEDTLKLPPNFVYVKCGLIPVRN